jgi:uncharacterized protein YbjT (DUF2867 family)
MRADRTQILITGGATFIGKHIAAALLNEGVPVALIVPQDATDTLGSLAEDVTCHTGDVWNPASLRGHARHARMVIHTVGSAAQDAASGRTYAYLNEVSLRNVANMCVTDGAPHLMLISASDALWLPRGYIRAKRNAEAYLGRVGLPTTVIRAPMLYQRGRPRHISYRLVSWTAAVTPLFPRSRPMPIDVFARGVARIAQETPPRTGIYYARDLTRRNTREERRGLPAAAKPAIDEPPITEDDTRPTVAPFR